MTKFSKLAFLMAAFFLFTIGQVFAQDKYGHLNSGNLIALMPETKAADSNLKAYQDQMIKKGQSMEKAMMEEYQTLMMAAQEGTKSQVELQAGEASLQKQQQDLAAYEQKVIQSVAQKREELYRPILEKIQRAIDEVGAEGGYKMIFDTSILVNNPILFAQESDDIMPKVKAKLGL